MVMLRKSSTNASHLTVLNIVQLISLLVEFDPPQRVEAIQCAEDVRHVLLAIWVYGIKQFLWCYVLLGHDLQYLRKSGYHRF